MARRDPVAVLRVVLSERTLRGGERRALLPLASVGLPGAVIHVAAGLCTSAASRSSLMRLPRLEPNSNVNASRRHRPK